MFEEIKQPEVYNLHSIWQALLKGRILLELGYIFLTHSLSSWVSTWKANKAAESYLDTI